MAQLWNQDPEHHASVAREIKPLQRTDSTHSRYVQMLLDVDDIPLSHSLLASFFAWLLLAGFLVLPGTFITLQRSVEGRHPDPAADGILKGVANIPLLVTAAVACAVSFVGMGVLALRHRDNYVWLLNKLVMPGVANCLAGLISTLVGVYSQQRGDWSVMAEVTAIVEGACLALAGGLFLFFESFLLRRVRKDHGTHYGDSSREDLTRNTAAARNF
ncbi:uncharacterized protein UV8b_04827 [Ustilaginoidea virens]|uniref:Uncharacterized protein n=1 Tax=Ustilaginoidea virens TaxID=1159556 RepID=A0A063BTS6_USTVR|nr:uncharacterized protein UV8b_04827 [Ustilaginoidea virens]QUC20586.1 hypothetical protein UV8b_04827 [Ustilaginoidea virens]GAO19767.1 hypothetical protein UVI_02041680 [Ustilaginoidea virens]